MGKKLSATKLVISLLQKEGAGDSEWLRWYYGFSLLPGKQYEKAAPVFAALAASAKDILAAGLAAYLLKETAMGSPESAQWTAKAAEGKDRVQKAVKSAANWEKKSVKLTAEVHGAIIKKYLDDAGVWIFNQ